MNSAALFSESLTSLRKNKVRSFLSMLGIVIGVAAVIAMVAIGEGAREETRKQIESLGDDWILIGYWGMRNAGVRTERGMPHDMTEREAEAIENECSTIRAATPGNGETMQAVSGYSNHSTRITGVYANYFDIRRWRTVAGSVFNQQDSHDRKRVCCLGSTAARELFGNRNPVGEEIRLDKLPFRVIGVLEEKGNTGGRDEDDQIVIPWGTFRTLAPHEQSMHLYAAAKPGIPIEIVKGQIRSLLRQRHKLAPEMNDDFRIIDRTMGARAQAESTATFNLLLMAIASISLVVGGVGIMNIMLVSVTERTREIGLRMAIGANGGTILGQFLTEAITLCGLGGLLGFAVGAGVAEFAQWKWEMPTILSYWMAGVAIAFSSAVGLFFGFYPAWRASRLDPIEALRFEYPANRRIKV
ncbi:MAG: ABC transporter permease [Phycisphaerae bacterium]